ncbi:MAG: hypothetical protein A2Z72_04130 [Omnitrophica bacterium RBG_13_46_9]|nr:MAG: hypothetical protein A2Z72_04130 [Omnitrophica bacterium RBG_13_46_9]
MRKIFIFIPVLLVASAFVWASSVRERTPTVIYLEPKDDLVVDMSGKESITFKWKSSPIPSGGRMNYKFELYKDFGYERIINELLDSEVFSIEVPADKFADGALYSWQVKQRDSGSRDWSMDRRWSFRVRK